LLTLSEVASACGVSRKTVRRWIATEGLPHIRKAAAGARPMLFVRPEDLAAWIEADRASFDSRAADRRTVRLNGRRFIGR
jgi:excisionase family DNA binding protein